MHDVLRTRPAAAAAGGVSAVQRLLPMPLAEWQRGTLFVTCGEAVAGVGTVLRDIDGRWAIICGGEYIGNAETEAEARRQLEKHAGV